MPTLMENAVQIRSVVDQPIGDIYAHPVATNEKGERSLHLTGWIS